MIIEAPGVSLRSAYPSGRSAIASGTSMASAVAAGAVAILTQLTDSPKRSGNTLRATASGSEHFGSSSEHSGSSSDHSEHSRGELNLLTALHSLAQPRSMTRAQFSESH